MSTVNQPSRCKTPSFQIGVAAATLGAVALAVSLVFVAHALVRSGTLPGKLHLFNFITDLNTKTSAIIAGSVGAGALALAAGGIYGMSRKPKTAAKEKVEEKLEEKLKVKPEEKLEVKPEEKLEVKPEETAPEPQPLSPKKQLDRTRKAVAVAIFKITAETTEQELMALRVKIESIADEKVREEFTNQLSSTLVLRNLPWPRTAEEKAAGAAKAAANAIKTQAKAGKRQK